MIRFFVVNSGEGFVEREVKKTTFILKKDYSKVNRKCKKCPQRAEIASPHCSATLGKPHWSSVIVRPVWIQIHPFRNHESDLVESRRMNLPSPGCASTSP